MLCETQINPCFSSPAFQKRAVTTGGGKGELEAKQKWQDISLSDPF